MKIVLTGGSSTGKTSLADEIYNQKIVQNLLYVDIKAIMVKMGYSNIDEIISESFLKFQKEIFIARSELESVLNDYVSDRCFIDGIAYLMAKNIDYKQYIDLYMKNIQKYDYIFYLPADCIPYHNNSFRSHSKEFNSKVDEDIKYLLDKYKIKYYTLSEPNFDQRIKIIKEIIK